ncbi:MAG: ABC transporter ATP-binding protein [Roseburia hominis]|uniref:ABC transporter ATP-binding protein n=2 Tax=Roseburia hominis TaxID=301301 RepID=UPI003A169B3E
MDEGGKIAMAIEIRDAVKKYGRGESEICALDHVNLRIEKGEVCVILGPSGSGKSTLLNMIGGLDRLDAGTVTVEGVELAKQNRKELTEYRRKNVGVVFQSYNLIAELTVQENIRVVADIAEHPLALAELMEDLGLSRHAKHFPSELSGGQQQRCAIGRALIKNPAILLCDEPTGALDSASAREVLAILEQINRKYHTTVIIITHNEAVAGMADRVIRLHDGKVKSNTENEKVRIEELDI